MGAVLQQPLGRRTSLCAATSLQTVTYEPLLPPGHAAVWRAKHRASIAAVEGVIQGNTTFSYLLTRDKKKKRLNELLPGSSTKGLVEGRTVGFVGS